MICVRSYYCYHFELPDIKSRIHIIDIIDDRIYNVHVDVFSNGRKQNIIEYQFRNKYLWKNKSNTNVISSVNIDAYVNKLLSNSSFKMVLWNEVTPNYVRRTSDMDYYNFKSHLTVYSTVIIIHSCEIVRGMINRRFFPRVIVR